MSERHERRNAKRLQRLALLFLSLVDASEENMFADLNYDAEMDEYVYCFQLACLSLSLFAFVLREPCSPIASSVRMSIKR